MNHNNGARGLTQDQLNAYWMPFSGNRQFKKDPRIIVSAEGNYFTDDRGRKVFDGLSGLWTCGAGHARPEIVAAVSQQIKTLDYAPAFQYGHPKAFQLAHRITEFMPAGLNRVFFTTSGSDAVDSALKIARAYWREKGQSGKIKLIGRAKGYHGVNFGGISVGGISLNRTLYGPAVEAYHLPHTLIKGNEFTRGMPQTGADLADELLQLIAVQGAESIAAVIVEPISGSAGVIVPPAGYLQRLREICTQHNILLIFDEVITAFGRTGFNTGAEAFGVVPDMMTVAKQLTNGTQPMGAVVVNTAIYDAFMDKTKPEYLLELPHGYTYSAHPVACAAALATLEILDQDNLIHRAAEMAPVFANALHSLKGCKHLSDIRNYGLAGGLTLEPVPNEPGLRPFQVAMACWERGFYVRYSADTLQLGLPFTVEPNEIDDLINVLGEAIDTVGRETGS